MERCIFDPPEKRFTFPVFKHLLEDDGVSIFEANLAGLEQVKNIFEEAVAHFKRHPNEEKYALATARYTTDLDDQGAKSALWRTFGIRIYIDKSTDINQEPLV
jgi:hypothetical protein